MAGVVSVMLIEKIAEVPASDITDERTYLDRRQFLGTAGTIALGAELPGRTGRHSEGGQDGAAHLPDALRRRMVHGGPMAWLSAARFHRSGAAHVPGEVRGVHDVVRPGADAQPANERSTMALYRGVEAGRGDASTHAPRDVGMLAWLTLLPLAITSTHCWVRRLDG